MLIPGLDESSPAAVCLLTRYTEGVEGGFCQEMGRGFVGGVVRHKREAGIILPA